jgi:hypothetical protein
MCFSGAPGLPCLPLRLARKLALPELAGKILAFLLEKRTARPREALGQAPKIPPSFTHLPRTSMNGPCATEDSEGRPANIFVVSLAPQCSYDARVQAVQVCAVGNARIMSLSSSNTTEIGPRFPGRSLRPECRRSAFNFGFYSRKLTSPPLGRRKK